MLDLDLDLDLTSLIRPVLDLYHNSLGPEKEIVSGNLSPTNLVTSSICVGCWNRQRAADKNVIFKQIIKIGYLLFLSMMQA